MSATGANPLAYQGVRAPRPPTVIDAQRAPNGTDINYIIGDIWVDRVGGGIYILGTVLAGVATWVGVGGGSADVNTINGLSPAAGNITIAGTANQVTVVSAGSTITLSIPSSPSFAGTVTAATGFTATTGNIVASAGNINATAGSMSAGTSITAGTTLTATLGAITATNGNLVFGTAGNKIITPAAANTATAGANAFGTVTLIAGTITVTTTAVTASSIILLTRQSVGASTDLGALTVGTITPGVSFVISADTLATPGTPLAADLSVVGWQIIN